MGEAPFLATYTLFHDADRTHYVAVACVDGMSIACPGANYTEAREALEKACAGWQWQLHWFDGERRFGEGP